MKCILLRVGAIAIMNRANQRRGEASNQHLHAAAQNALPPASFEWGDDGSGQPEHGHSQPRALNISHRVEHSDECSMVRSSSCGAGGECGGRSPRSSPERCDECAEILHQLANVITGIVVNAQMLDWKLPPYSRIKRPMVEIERSAQRGSELLKGLQQRLAQRSARRRRAAKNLPSLHFQCRRSHRRRRKL